MSRWKCLVMEGDGVVKLLKVRALRLQAGSQASRTKGHTEYLPIRRLWSARLRLTTDAFDRFNTTHITSCPLLPSNSCTNCQLRLLLPYHPHLLLLALIPAELPFSFNVRLCHHQLSLTAAAFALWTPTALFGWEWGCTQVCLQDSFEGIISSIQTFNTC